MVYRIRALLMRVVAASIMEALPAEHVTRQVCTNLHVFPVTIVINQAMGAVAVIDFG
jgi:hypothetical protein